MSPIRALDRNQIWLYPDLLLHDMNAPGEAQRQLVDFVETL